jgi:hypothetical protein
MERCKNRNSILGKWKRVLEGDIKAWIEEKSMQILEAHPVLTDSTSHNRPIYIKKWRHWRVSSDLSIAQTSAMPLLGKPSFHGSSGF